MKAPMKFIMPVALWVTLVALHTGYGILQYDAYFRITISGRLLEQAKYYLVNYAVSAVVLMLLVVTLLLVLRNRRYVTPNWRLYYNLIILIVSLSLLMPTIHLVRGFKDARFHYWVYKNSPDKKKKTDWSEFESKDPVIEWPSGRAKKK